MSSPVFDEAEFDAYCDEVEVYEQTWHTEPEEPQRSYLSTRPKLKAELFQRVLAGKRTFTNHVYAERGIWSPERKSFQAGLLPIADTSVTGSGTESIYFLIGLPGSGKSSALRPLVATHSGLPLEAITVSDADELRVKFPEYSDGKGSGVVQDECAELMYNRQVTKPELGVQGAILNAGGVTIVDVIGSPDHLPPLVRRLRRLGRKVYVLQAKCDTATCVSRAKYRALASGRLVPPSLILAKVGVPEKTLDAVRSEANPSGWAVVDTSALEPVILESSGFDFATAA
ncbi:zeta toxin family protein [Paenarthrobacter sp. NPDC089714]|uniref:zeta toxin family protein n=1 Tax=Paenarthrobacter sp. NPDC089714 TaxID=3364377 RepID=UPI003811C0D5